MSRNYQNQGPRKPVINRCELVGIVKSRTGNDADAIRFIPWQDGRGIIHFTLHVVEEYEKDGQMKSRSDFIPVNASVNSARSAEFLRSIQPGMKVRVVGAVHMESYNTRNGDKRSVLAVDATIALDVLEIPQQQFAPGQQGGYYGAPQGGYYGQPAPVQPAQQFPPQGYAPQGGYYGQQYPQAVPQPQQQPAQQYSRPQGYASQGGYGQQAPQPQAPAPRQYAQGGQGSGQPRQYGRQQAPAPVPPYYQPPQQQQGPAAAPQQQAESPKPQSVADDDLPDFNASGMPIHDLNV